MTTTATPWERLWTELHELRDRTLRAGLAITDAPEYGRVHLIDQLNDLAMEQAASVELSIGAIAGVDRSSPSGTLQALSECAAVLQVIRERHSGALFSLGRVGEIESVGRAGGPEWLLWSGTLIAALEACRRPIDAAMDRLIECLENVAQTRVLTATTT